MNRMIALCLLAGIGFTACSGSSAKEEALAKAAALKQVKDSLALDSFRKAEIAEKERLEQEKLQAQERQAINDAAGISHSETEQGDQYYQASEPSATPVATTEQKKGWSDAAKGTAIGAGAGAVMGAIIDKDKRLRGAAIGAAIGGTGGYVIGRKKDRQSGRVQ